jgi:hypothetical protein
VLELTAYVSVERHDVGGMKRVVSGPQLNPAIILGFVTVVVTVEEVTVEEVAVVIVVVVAMLALRKWVGRFHVMYLNQKSE